jgi:hypothetical protein
VNCRVEIIRDLFGPFARIYVGSTRFSVIPRRTFAGEDVAVICEWHLPSLMHFRSGWVDSQGNPTANFPNAQPGENFGWLLDLAMDAGLEFPALHGG